MGLGGGGGGGGGVGEGGMCYKSRVRAVDANVLMLACTLQHTFFKLMSLVNIMVAFESLRPTVLSIQKCTHRWGGGGHDPLAPRPGYATGSNMRHSVTLTFVMVDSPIRYDTMHTTRINHSLRFRNKCGHSSTQAVMKPSIVQNWGTNHRQCDAKSGCKIIRL